MTTLDLPDPLGPMMVRSHPLPVEVCSGPNSHSTSLTNSSTRRSRPKKSPRVVLREGPQPFVWIAWFVLWFYLNRYWERTFLCILLKAGEDLLKGELIG